MATSTTNFHIIDLVSNLVFKWSDKLKFLFQLLLAAGDCVSAFAAAMILYLLIEMPFKRVANLFFDAKQVSKSTVSMNGKAVECNNCNKEKLT